MEYPTVAYFTIEGKWYKSRSVFWNEQEEEDWLSKYKMEINDILIVEATEHDIKDSQEEGDEFIECEDEEEEVK